MAKLLEQAQRRLGEPVLAAIAVQPGLFTGTGGSSTSGMSPAWAGAGALGAVGALLERRARLRHAAEQSSLPLTVNMILAVTPDRVHLLDAGGSGPGTVASWQRRNVRIDTTAVGLTREIVLEVPDPPGRIGLGVTTKRGAREFVEALGGLGDAGPRTV